MKIAWIVYGSLAERTGGTIYDARIVEGLRAAGDHVEVVSLRQAAAPRARSRASAELVRRLRRASPDVVVGDELCHEELARAFSRCAFVRRVLLVHHLMCWEEELPPLRRARARVAEALVIRSSDQVVTTSRATAERLRKEGYRGRFDVVLPGADRLPRAARVRTAPPSEPTPTRFVFLGSITARKRVRELVVAFARARISAHLRLVGSCDRDPRYARAVEQTIDMSGLRDCVSFTGEIDERAVARELAAADALVMPSSLEGYGIAATEAIHAGIPVIAAHTPALAEALLPAKNAHVLVESDDDLVDAIRRFVSVPELRASLTANARAAAMPTWAAAVSAFRDALARSPDPGRPGGGSRCACDRPPLEGGRPDRSAPRSPP